MKEILEFIFQDFYHFVGFMIILYFVCMTICDVAESIFKK